MKKQININIDIDHKLYDLICEVIDEDEVSEFVEKIIYCYISNKMLELIGRKVNKIADNPKYN